MTSDTVIALLSDALKMALLIASPMLIFGLTVGLVVSIFQSVTQIQEMTLSFIPKIVAVVVAVIVFAPWMLQKMVSYSAAIFGNLHMYIGK
ncbi:MAG: flagellar biosynthesis protein FliQ [Geovibrio sp.]|uniref:flagellar biosynthesis protein FliQ n=1 Tax=Geovibrio ferrireducens TaxID=46201 RepID=UPI002246A2F9|nr:flagellar biosynthesis protein FliQ [Geovibrio ferrireducens]MCD8567881.1 flagellar biosynthesis protein FliQ [Geovibrio sp.]